MFLYLIAYRSRLADPDGLSGKWFIDALHLHRIIDDDDGARVAGVAVIQRKCPKKEERTEIIIRKL